MTPRNAYEQNRRLGMPRIDMILTVYDGVIARLEQAQQVPAERAAPLVAEARLAVATLAIGADSGRVAAGELGRNFLRLYDFVLHCLNRDVPTIADALDVLRTLREGFQSIRTQALELERGGVIPPIDREHAVQSMA